MALLTKVLHLQMKKVKRKKKT